MQGAFNAGDSPRLRCTCLHLLAEIWGGQSISRLLTPVPVLLPSKINGPVQPAGGGARGVYGTATSNHFVHQWGANRGFWRVPPAKQSLLLRVGDPSGYAQGSLMAMLRLHRWPRLTDTRPSSPTLLLKDCTTTLHAWRGPWTKPASHHCLHWSS